MRPDRTYKLNSNDIKTKIDDSTKTNTRLLITESDIMDKIDLSFLDISIPISFVECTFNENVDISNMRSRMIHFEGCVFCKSLNAYNITVNGTVFLTKSIFEDEINLHGSKITGNIEFKNCVLQKNTRLDRIQINGMLLLQDNKNSSFTLALANIGAIEIRGKDAVSNYTLELDGLIFKHFFSIEKQHLNWLTTKMRTFKPQPYKQLAKVISEIGDKDTFVQIMIEYNNKLYEEKKAKFRKASMSQKDIYIIPFELGFQIFFRIVSGYGYKPARLIFTMLATWFLCGLIFWHAAIAGVFAPSNAVVFQNESRYCCFPNESGAKFNQTETDPSKNWYFSSLKGEYTTFQPFWYSLDVLLPLVDFYMEKDWGVYIPAPKDSVEPLDFSNMTYNHFVRIVIWFEIAFGWILSLILVGILSGLAKSVKD